MRFKIAPTAVGVFFSLIIAVSASASEAPKLTSVLNLLISQAAELRKNLINLRDLNLDQEQIRKEYLDFLDETLDYYRGLEINPDGSNVKSLAAELKEKRDGFNPEFKKISDFVLVFQAKNVLKTASNRFVKINSDLSRLIDLKILDREKPEFLLNEAHLLLVGAGDLVDQAEELVSTTEAQSQIRDLISAALIKIKLAYKKFLEISNLLKEALK